MSKTTIFCASDHRGFALKTALCAALKDKGFSVTDCGTENGDRCDASDYAVRVAEGLRQNPESKAVLICGTGQMMSITANRFKHIRAALCMTPDMAQKVREHNNANILVLASDLMDLDLCKDCLDRFLQTSFLEGRYAERIEKLEALGGL